MSEPRQLHTPKHDQTPAFKIAAAAIFAALVAAVTIVFIVPIPATSGYFNFGETIIYVAALLLGPAVGAAAGAGAFIADMLAGPAYAPGTFTIKAIEGFLVGYLTKALYKKTNNLTLSASVAVIIGGLEMVAGYFIYEQAFLGVPFLGALAEVPFNIVQMAVGLVIAVPVMFWVMRIFPQLRSYLQ